MTSLTALPFVDAKNWKKYFLCRRSSGGAKFAAWPKSRDRGKAIEVNEVQLSLSISAEIFLIGYSSCLAYPEDREAFHASLNLGTSNLIPSIIPHGVHAPKTRVGWAEKEQ